MWFEIICERKLRKNPVYFTYDIGLMGTSKIDAKKYEYW